MGNSGGTLECKDGWKYVYGGSGKILNKDGLANYSKKAKSQIYDTNCAAQLFQWFISK
jgi:hypothetical protein